MFRSATIYQCTQATGAILKRLTKALSSPGVQFAECMKTAKGSAGFVPPLGGDSTEMTYETNGGVLFCLRTDTKSIPAGFVKDKVRASLAKRIAAGEDPSVVDERLIKDDIIAELLPGIPPAPSRTFAYIDKTLGMLFIDANEAGADAFMECLKRALAGTPFKLLGTATDPCSFFTEWLRDPEKLEDALLELGDNCSLKQAQEGGTAIVNIQHDDLKSDEMRSMLDAGKTCCRIGLVCGDATFAITAKLGIRRLKLDEGDRDDEDEARDVPSEFATTVTVVRSILGTLEPLLGGWPKQELLDLGDEQENAA